MPHRSVLLGGALSAVLLLGCTAEAVGVGPDAQQDDPDAAVPLQDAALLSDGSEQDGWAVLPCEAPLGAGVVVGTSVAPTEPSPQVLEYLLEGEATYHGDVTEPLAMNPAFDRELQLEHADGSVSTLQYFLPLGLTVPIAIGGGYSALYRQVIGFEGNATGLVLTRMTSGLPPLVLVLDLGEYGRAFEPEDPVMAPLKVYAEPSQLCHLDDPLGCGGVLLGHWLTFDSSTGGAMTWATLQQGWMDVLPIFGFDHHVVALSAVTRSETCPDVPVSEDAYLSVLAE